MLTSFSALVLAGLAVVAPAQPAVWVTVRGQVVLPAGVAIPPPKQLAGAPEGVLDDSVVINSGNRGVRNVMIWLRPDSTDRLATLARNQIHPEDAQRIPQDVVIDQPGALFEPRILTARAGDKVVLQNSSDVVRNFQWTSSANGEVNLNILPGRMFRSPNTLVVERAPCGYKSGIHPWMVGYARVFDHPYYALTDGDGKFEIKNAPAGKFRLVIWHRNSGYLKGREGILGEPIVLAPGKDGPMVLSPIAFDVTK